MENNNITLLDWPAQSPDLNPIEHLWDHAKNKLKEYPILPKGVWQVWERVEEVWNNILPEVCQNLIESMPRRLEPVIKAKEVLELQLTISLIPSPKLSQWALDLNCPYLHHP